MVREWFDLPARLEVHSEIPSATGDLFRAEAFPFGGSGRWFGAHRPRIRGRPVQFRRRSGADNGESPHVRMVRGSEAMLCGDMLGIARGRRVTARPDRMVGRWKSLAAALKSPAVRSGGLMLAVLVAFTAPTADALAAARSSAPAINAIRVGSHPDRLRVVLDATATVKYKASLDKSGTVLLIHLPGAAWSTKHSGRFTQNPVAVGWTTTATRNGVSLSIGLSRPMTIVATALLPSDGGQQRLVVDIADGRVGSQRAAQAAAAPPAGASGAAAGTVVASDMSPRPLPSLPRSGLVPARLAMPGHGDPSGIALGLAPGMPGSMASGSFAISLGFVPTESALRLGMAPDKPQDASGGNPLKGSASTSLMGNPMDMDWGFERGAFALKMSGPGEGDLIWASRLRFRDKSLTLGVMMPF